MGFAQAGDEQDRLGRLTGTVTEDATIGMPVTGTIAGKLAFPLIDFVKQMPIFYMGAENGQVVTLRAYLAAQGLACAGDPPHPPIEYQGRFSDASEARGSWIIKPFEISLTGGMSMPMPELAGGWRIKRATA